MYIITKGYHSLLIMIATKLISAIIYFSKTVLRQALLNTTGISVNTYNNYKRKLGNNNQAYKFIYYCPRNLTLGNIFINTPESI